jgi:hypothetical protein
MKTLIHAAAFGLDHYKLAVMMVASARVSGYSGEINVVTDMEADIPGARTIHLRDHQFLEHQRRWKMYRSSCETNGDYMLAKLSPHRFVDIASYDHVVLSDCDVLYKDTTPLWTAKPSAPASKDSKFDAMRKLAKWLTSPSAAAAKKAKGFSSCVISIPKSKLALLIKSNVVYTNTVDYARCNDGECLNYVSNRDGFEVSPMKVGGTVEGFDIAHFKSSRARMESEYAKFFKP